MKRLIYALLLVLAFSAPVLAEDVLVERYENANKYQTGPDTYRLDMGGPISNAEPFDYDGPLEPESYDFSNATQIYPDVWQLRHGRFGYTANMSNTTSGGMGGGCIRTHPVRKRWDVYYELCPVNPIELSHRQVSDKLLELYKSTPQVRYSFFIGDRGFKINMRLKPSWTGGDTFSHTFDVAMAGLTRQGRRVFYQGKQVGRLPNPSYKCADMTDSSEVIETLQGGRVTLSASGLSGHTLPCDVDPTLGPINPSKDAFLSSSAATTGYGQSVILSLLNRAPASHTRRWVVQHDISAIPAGATVTSATSEFYYESFTLDDPVGLAVDMTRLNTEGWDDNGDATLNEECNWTNYLESGPTAWPSGSGAADVDATNLVSSTIPAATGTMMSFTPTALAQDAIDNHAGIFNVRVKFQAEDKTVANDSQASFDSLESLTPAQRPRFTAIFTIPAVNHAIKPWCKGDSYANRACLPFGSLFPNQ